MARNSLWGVLSTLLFVCSTLASAQYGGSGLHTSELCHGDVYHQPHNWSANECADTYNPHFAQLSNGLPDFNVGYQHPWFQSRRSPQMTPTPHGASPARSVG